MEDIIQKYNKQKKIKNLSIIALSLFFALSLNIVVYKTDTLKYLKSSVLDTTMTQEQGNLYLEQVGDKTVSLKASKTINDVTSISFVLAYNAENIELIKKISKIDSGEVLNLSDKGGLNTVIVNFSETVDIEAGQDILAVFIKKEKPVAENINISNANFIDKEGNNYMLTTSGVDIQ